MSISSTHRALSLVSLILGVALASPGLTAPQKAGDPFDQLKGEWKGDGVVITDDGQPNKVSCTRKYQVTVGNIVQTLYCKGNDYEVNTTLKVTERSGKIKGSWNESVYDASGTVTGTAKGDTVHALIAGDKFSGRMSIKLHDADHTINIVKLNNKSGTYKLATSLTFKR